MTQSQKQSLGVWIALFSLVLTGGAWSGRLESRTGDIKATQEVHSEAIKELLKTSVDQNKEVLKEIGELKVQQGRVEEQIKSLKEQIAK